MYLRLGCPPLPVIPWPAIGSVRIPEQVVRRYGLDGKFILGELGYTDAMLEEAAGAVPSAVAESLHAT